MSFSLLFLQIRAIAGFVPRRNDDPSIGVLVRLDMPEADVLKGVSEVTQDQIIHGTYSYEKEKLLYGAHSAESAKVYGPWKGPGKAFYKVADKVLAPRFFKNSGDIGTVTVRYVVLAVSPEATTLQINAIFVDARGVKHPSDGSVESSEYAAVQEHVKTMQADRRRADDATQQIAVQRTRAEHVRPGVDTSVPAIEGVSGTSSVTSVQDLQKQVDSLRRQVELRVKDSGAALKSAPFRGATTLTSLPPHSEVVIVVLTTYWYGVETQDGHHGWVHHSQLEAIE
jgi:hypothetical protein